MKAPAAAPPKPEDFQLLIDKRLDLALLSESKTNPRRIFKGIEELAASIRAHANVGGLLQALLVRPFKGNGKYEIVAGARRFRAAKLAGLVDVPCRIGAFTDEQVCLLALAENHGREDVHPIEEADGYANALKLEGYTIERLIEKTGHDASFIYRRLSLARLIEPAKQAFVEERIELGHALRIARLANPDDQARAFAGIFPSKWIRNKPVPDFTQPADCNVRELDDLIKREITLELSAAPWKKDDPDLVPSAGACTTCMKRSGAQTMLFETEAGTRGRSDLCTDSACYTAKIDAFVQIEITRTREAGGGELVRIAFDHHTVEEAKEAGVLASGTYTRVDGAKACDHVEPAIVASGRDLGKRLKICRSKDCKLHFGRSSGGSRGPVHVKTWAEKRKDLDLRIVKAVHAAAYVAIAQKPIEETYRDRALGFLGKKLLERLGHDVRKSFGQALILEPEKRQHGSGLVYDKALDKRLAEGVIADTALAFLVAGCAVNPYAGRPGFTGTESDKVLAEACAIAGVNLAELKKKIGGPLIGRFEASKSKAETKAKKPAESPAAKKLKGWKRSADAARKKAAAKRKGAK